MNKIYKKLLFLLISLFFLSACGDMVLIESLTQRDSNDILVLLYQNGIEGKLETRKKAQDVSYAILLNEKELFQARNLLKRNNMPRVRELDLEKICGKEIMIPTPEYERCRENVGRQGTIANNLMKLPEVVYASVVLNVPTVNEFATESQLSKRPTASVVVRAKLGKQGFKLTETKIQRHVSSSVEGLDPRDVSVIISYIELDDPLDPNANPDEKSQQTTGDSKSVELLTNQANLVSVMGLQMTVESKKRFKIYAVLALVLLMVVSASLLFAVMKIGQLRKSGASLNPLLAVSQDKKTPKMIESQAEPIAENEEQDPEFDAENEA